MLFEMYITLVCFAFYKFLRLMPPPPLYYTTFNALQMNSRTSRYNFGYSYAPASQFANIKICSNISM